MTRLAALLALALLPACVGQLTGYSAPYPPPQPFAVAVPPNAPSLSQQFAPERGHIATDFVSDPGRPVLAAAPGRVKAVYFSPAYGNVVEVGHGLDAQGRPIVTRYVHLQRQLVAQGQPVARGQQIATLGRTGVLAGGIPHLHFEVWIGPMTDQESTVDANTLWVDGTGRVTCFEAGREVPDRPFRITHPVACE